MDVAKGALGHSSRPIALALGPVILLNSNRAPRNPRDPGDVAEAASVGLRNAPGLGRAVDGRPRRAGGVVPEVGVAPVGALVAVVEVDAEHPVDAEGDEAGALALVVVPGVDAAATALVGVVVRKDGDAVRGLVLDGGAHVGNVLLGARVDVKVGDVAAVRGLVPDAAAVDGGALGLAGDLEVLVVGVGADDARGLIRVGVAGDGIGG